MSTNLSKIERWTSTIHAGAFLMIDANINDKIISQNRKSSINQVMNLDQIVNISKQVFSDQRCMELEILLKDQKTLKNEAIQRISDFLCKKDIKTHILIICGESRPTELIQFGLINSPEETLSSSDLLKIWREALEINSEKRLLLVLDIENSTAIKKRINEEGFIGISIKFFDKRLTNSGGKEIDTFGYRPGEMLTYLLKMNDSRNDYSYIAGLNHYTRSFFRPELFTGNEGLVNRELSFNVILNENEDSGEVRSIPSQLNVNYYIGYVDSKTGLPQGYGQVKSIKDTIIFEALFEQGKVTRLLTEEETTNGEYFGYYNRNGPMTLIRTDDVIKNQSFVITQSFVDGLRTIDIADHCRQNNQNKFTFSELTGDAKLVYNNSRRYSRFSEVGHFVDGLLHGEGKRIKLTSDYTIREKGLFENGVLVKGVAKNEYGISNGTFVEGMLTGSGTKRSNYGTWYKGDFESGEFVKGKIEFAYGVQFKEFRGSTQNYGGEWEGRMWYPNRFIAEGVFDYNHSLKCLGKLYGPNGRLVENAVLYSNDLKGKDLVAIDERGNVFMGDFKYGEIMGPICAIRYFRHSYDRFAYLRWLYKSYEQADGDLVFSREYKSVLEERYGCLVNLTGF